MYIRCDKCGGLLRPHVVWFGEALETEVLQKTDEVLAKCDLCLLVSGTQQQLLYRQISNKNTFIFWGISTGFFT